MTDPAPTSAAEVIYTAIQESDLAMESLPDYVLRKAARNVVEALAAFCRSDTTLKPACRSESPGIERQSEVQERIKAMAAAFDMSHASCGDSAFWREEFEREWKAALAASQPPAGAAEQEAIRSRLRTAIEPIKEAHPYHIADVVLDTIRPHLRTSAAQETAPGRTESDRGAGEVEASGDALSTALEDLHAIRRAAGDIDIGYFGGKMRGNIGGVVSRACDRVEKYLRTSAAQETAPGRTESDRGAGEVDEKRLHAIAIEAAEFNLTNGNHEEGLDHHSLVEDALEALSPYLHTSAAEVEQEATKAILSCYYVVRELNRNTECDNKGICNHANVVRAMIKALHNAGFRIVRDTAQQPET